MEMGDWVEWGLGAGQPTAEKDVVIAMW